MKKIYNIFASALVLLFALQGCTKTYIKEVVDDQKQEEEGAPVVEEDDITKILSGVKGVSNVVIKMAATTVKSDTKTSPESPKYVKQYFFSYEQPVDHFNPEKGVFYQRVGMQLTDLKNPVVVETMGYAMTMNGEYAIGDDLNIMLNANYLQIEFRYFGESQPEGMDNVDFTYLYSEQSAYDIHRVVTMLKENLFKEKVKWLATGTSKNGITSALHAYYADQKGWNDFDVYVPFCAPFLAGTPTSPLDRNMGKYIFTVCGSGYQAGTTEARGYANLQKIFNQINTKPVLRNAVLCKYHAEAPTDYNTIKTQLNGATEEGMLAGFYLGFMETLLGRFSYHSFSKWAPLIPDPDPIKEGDKPGESILMSPLDSVLDFVFMGEKEFEEMIKKENAETKGIHTKEEMLEMRVNPEVDLPYYVASVRELGAVGVDFSWLPDNSFFTAEVGYQVEELAIGRARNMDYYEGQWDGGVLMTSLRNWVATSKQKMVFVYGSNDPWTGGAIDDAAAQANPNVVKVVNFGGIHNSNFLHEEDYTKEASTQIQNAIKDFLSK